jgi:hypothetical protein
VPAVTVSDEGASTLSVTAGGSCSTVTAVSIRVSIVEGDEIRMYARGYN